MKMFRGIQWPLWPALMFLVAGTIATVASQITGMEAELPYLPVIAWDLAVIAMIPRVGPIVATLVLAAEIAVIVGQLFGMRYLVFSLPELFRNIAYFPATLQFVLFGAIVTLSLFAVAALRLAHKKAPPALIVLMLATVPLAQALEWSVRKNVLGSVVWMLWNDQQWTLGFLSGSVGGPDFEAESPVPDVDGAVERALNAGNHVVMILVESMGVAVTGDLNAELLGFLDTPRIRQRYLVSHGSREFQGTTMHGELRELCGLRLRNMFFSTLPADCWPARFRDAGYLVTAYHGNDARFYRRSAWYPQAGFQHVEDIHTLAGSGSRRCGGGWAGYCDLDLLYRVGTADLSKPRFDYVLTLNSHTPNEAMTQGNGRVASCEDGAYPSTVCTHLGNIARALREIEYLLSVREHTTVIVVGDHAPRFLLNSENRYFDQTRVPYFVFEPLEMFPRR